ncbi:hypothetical protein P3X46_028020 [Hevea brasiliensis]|uniref:Uncharacterized protein n=1 Tax=Hevea brasiliensis TaxID=3981 RepID=A0ABQ9KMP4_HEVBR|nr:hypothetical protein P3X46_028020 [Hevea brasiliensis]
MRLPTNLKENLVSKESPPTGDNSLETPCKPIDTMTIMITNTVSLEEQITKMSKLLETLVDSVKEKDNQIAYLMNKVERITQKGPMVTKELQLKGHQGAAESFTAAIIKSSQLKDFIKEAIEDQVDGVTQPSYSYVKPYSPRINLMKMTINYQPLKFQ